MNGGLEGAASLCASLGKLKVPILEAILCAPRLDFSSIPLSFVSPQLSLCQVPESLPTELPFHLGHRQVKTIQSMGLWGSFPRLGNLGMLPSGGGCTCHLSHLPQHRAYGMTGT